MQEYTGGLDACNSGFARMEGANAKKYSRMTVGNVRDVLQQSGPNVFLNVVKAIQETMPTLLNKRAGYTLVAF